MTDLHIYRKRHLFHGDSLIGRADRGTRTVWLEPGNEALADEAEKFVRRACGWKPLTVRVGDCPPPRVPYKFPPQIVRMSDPSLGDRTPAVVLWARFNLTADQWADIYGRWDMPQHDGVEPVVPEQAAAEKPRRGRGRPRKIEPTDNNDERTNTDTDTGPDADTGNES